MNARNRSWIPTCFAITATVVSTYAGSLSEFTDEEIRRILSHSPLPDVPPDPTNRFADDPRAARFGQFIFFDAGFSANGKISCATCHDPAHAFGDARPLSEGLQKSTRHAPSLLNAAYARWQFWDGRADSLWAQALQPLERPQEMGSSRVAVLRRIGGAPQLRAAYTDIFGPLPDLPDPGRLPNDSRPDPMNAESAHHLSWAALSTDQQDAISRAFSNVGKAIAAYERKLISRDAPFDRFVEGLRNGDSDRLAALSPAARRGLKLFVGRGNCSFCHSGPNFSDGEFHSVRVAPLDGGRPRDPGRFEGIPLVQSDLFNAGGVFSDDPTGPAARRLKLLARPTDLWGHFKTPTLRGVAESAPYMHQGQFSSLADVVGHYSTFENALPLGHHVQETTLVPLDLTPGELLDLVSFLESLTGAPIPPELVLPPHSP